MKLLTLEDYELAGQTFWPKYWYVAKELGEDAIIDKTKDDDTEKRRIKDLINPLLLRNIRSIKRLAKEQGISVKELIQMLRDE